MILHRSKNSKSGISQIRLSNEPYLFINLFLAAAIALIIIYSAIFSPSENNYPVACIHEKLTGQQCASCGLSHSLSFILRGDISEAYKWNSNGMRVFVFFACQLLMRIIFPVLYLMHPSDRRNLVITDSAGSVLMFLIAFWPFIRWMIIMLAS